LVLRGIRFPIEPTEPIFVKKVLIFEKKGGAELFLGLEWRAVWADSLLQI
jgi:hypothetical protein